MGGLYLEFARDILVKNKSSEIDMYFLLFSMYILLQLNRRGPCNLEEAECRSTTPYHKYTFLYKNSCCNENVNSMKLKSIIIYFRLLVYTVLFLAYIVCLIWETNFNLSILSKPI